MATEVLVPPLGQTVDTLTLVSWYRNEGDAVQQGEPLYALETDKATLDIEAPATGILQRVTAQPGDELKALSAIAVIVAAGEDVEAQRSSSVGGQKDVPAAGHPAAPPPVHPHAETRPRIFVSPRARRLAEGEGVPLAEVKATGPEGAIIERDVRAYLAQRATRLSPDIEQTPLPPELGGQGGRVQRTEPPPISPVARRMAEEADLDWSSLTGSGPRGQIIRGDVARALAAASPEPVEIIPLAGIRGVIAERMGRSHAQTASVTLTAEADATNLVALRQQLAADGVNVSYNALFLHVLARALREHPRLNASLDGERIKLWRQIDIGLAVDTEQGLLVPVVRDVDRKGLAQLTDETRDLTARAHKGQCTPDELRGSTFTLTNLGMFGIDAFTPLINLPECAILGVGRIKMRPAWVAGQVTGRETVWLSLTFDHRLVDGGPAARFLQRVVQLVEKPHLLIT